MTVWDEEGCSVPSCSEVCRFAVATGDGRRRGVIAGIEVRLMRRTVAWDSLHEIHSPRPCWMESASQHSAVALIRQSRAPRCRTTESGAEGKTERRKRPKDQVPQRSNGRNVSDSPAERHPSRWSSAQFSRLHTLPTFCRRLEKIRLALAPPSTTFAPSQSVHCYRAPLEWSPRPLFRSRRARKRSPLRVAKSLEAEDRCCNLQILLAKVGS